MSVECPKHEFQEEYDMLFAMAMNCDGLAKTLPIWMQITILFIRESSEISWDRYLSATCTCFDDAATMRLGQSWASGGASPGPSWTIRPVSDVADLNDFLDFSDVE